MQTPDKWVLIKTKSKAKVMHYKLLGGWYGGYLQGDSWKLNSGITKVEEFPEYYLVSGQSGSMYKCIKMVEGFNHMTKSVFISLKNTARTEGYVVTHISMKEYLEHVKRPTTL